MYDFDLVREVCGMITQETDEEKVEELLSILRSIIRAESDEARLRIRYIVSRYRPVLVENIAS
jgi:hypothetical protein